MVPLFYLQIGRTKIRSIWILPFALEVLSDRAHNNIHRCTTKGAVGKMHGKESTKIAKSLPMHGDIEVFDSISMPTDAFKATKFSKGSSA